MWRMMSRQRTIVSVVLTGRDLPVLWVRNCFILKLFLTVTLIESLIPYRRKCIVIHLQVPDGDNDDDGCGD